MTRAGLEVLGLFPSVDPHAVGGVQTSGRLAWEAVADAFGAGRARLFATATGPGRPAALGPMAKLRVVREALRGGGSPGIVLVWHLALLRLVPLFRASGGRVIVFLHGIEAWKAQDWLTRPLLSRVDLFLSNSDHTWERFVAANPDVAGAAHRTVHLGLGAPIAAPPPPGSPSVALMVGRLLRAEDYKGHREMIAAWPRVRARVPGAELWIAGDGDLRPDLERAARAAGEAGSIRFWGEVADADKERLLIRSRCLALPSRAEGFGLVYLEAMRLGRPCLVGSADAGREVVEPPEAGLAADPARPSELAAATVRLLSPGSEWSRWSEAARRRYERRFTAAQFRERLLAGLSIPGDHRLAPVASAGRP